MLVFDHSIQRQHGPTVRLQVVLARCRPSSFLSVPIKSRPTKPRNHQLSYCCRNTCATARTWHVIIRMHCMLPETRQVHIIQMSKAMLGNVIVFPRDLSKVLSDGRSYSAVLAASLP